MKNTKYIFITMIVLSMIIISSCDEAHTHNWKTEITTPPSCEQTGIVTKTCIECGTVEKETVAATGHKEGVDEIVIQPSCLTSGKIDNVCPDCGKVFSFKEIPAKGHVPGTLTMIKVPTCTENGEEESVCTVCGEVLGHRILDPLGHDVENAEKEVITEASCESVGKANLICPVCHETFDDVVLPELGHHWGGRIITKAPSCTEEGAAIETCSRNEEHTRIVTLETLPHIYEGVSTIKISPSCTTEGEMQISCLNCDDCIITPIPVTGHTMSESPVIVEKEATDFESGTGIWKCLNCDYTETRTIPMLHKHKLITDAPSPWDDGNIYGKNEKGTCSSTEKIYAYCTCYMDAVGNCYKDSGEGRERYMLVDPETNEPYVKEGYMDLSNHAHISSLQIEGKGYFSAGIVKNVCDDCGEIVSVERIEGEKYSADGKWSVLETFADEYGEYTLDADIEAYTNGIDILKYLGNSLDEGWMDWMETAPVDGAELLSHTTDGRWVSKWDTVFDSESNQKKFFFAKGAKYAYLWFLSDDYEKQMMTYVLYYDGETPEDSIFVDVYRQDLPSNKGILTIDAEGLSTFSSFSKNEEGVDVVQITKGTPVSLAWIDLTETPATSWRWTDNESEVSLTDSYSFTETEAVDHIITCTAAGETHKVLLKFVDPS